MGKPVIEVKNLSKSFKHWDDHSASLKKLLVNAVTGKLKLGEKKRVQILENVSFDIHEGEFVGIMGANGAGKSTLLKLISGIYAPTSGEIKVHAPIAPLIELGAGFHGDLSGYENIFLNAAILGFGRKATLEAIPEILEFSELGEAVHKPVKHFSSGMLVRLGFSIAAHLNAKVMLCDEVLAVGDAGFQEKCLKKIHSLYEEGRTIVLITHSGEAVRQFCKRSIIISNQKVVFDGATSEGVDLYYKIVGGSVSV
jgi:ABC-type polysaccharide/polyol phosphate transport system ATPase subunit